MPYRRLPNTDAARVRALEVVTGRQLSPDVASRPFPPALKQRIELFLPRFKTAIANSRVAREKQATNSRRHAEYTRKAKLYISHFLQVLNFAIIRGEFKPSARVYYGIDEDESRLPALVSDQDLLEWGEKIIRGEQERVHAGGTPVYSPSVALVRVNYENFKQAHFSRKQFQQNVTRYSAEVARFREEADALVLALWDEIESFFGSRAGDEEQRRAECERYGIAYVFRKGEREKIERQQEIERVSPRLPF
ncbi:MAG: hypothetical protein LBF09_05075 [Odoribacteraceae bacterium]|jgi:hypothetical protein|nr:hypothetical protein [Odoribacteraceae bacterium]